MGITLLLLAPIMMVILYFILKAPESVPYDEFRASGGNQYVKLEDGWTNYELSKEVAAAHTVVLIHGGTIPLGIWEAQMEPLRKAGFRILRYDQYGRGFSDRPASAVHSRELFVRQLKNLLDALSITEPVTLVGPSFGGAISVGFAARYPERVRSLVLISPALNILASDSPLAFPVKLLRIPFAGELAYALFIRSKIISRGRSMVPGGRGSPCDETFVAQFRCIGTQRSLFSMFRSDAYGDYRELTREAGRQIDSILLMRGREDREITEKMISETRADLPRARYMEIEKSGHNPGTDAAERFNAMLIEFIASQ